MLTRLCDCLLTSLARAFSQIAPETLSSMITEDKKENKMGTATR